MKDSGPVHPFPSFAQYLKKVFHPPAYMARLTDARRDPDISPQTVFRALLYGFVFRTPSLKQLEADVDDPCFQRWIGAPRAFKDDVFRYSLCGFALDPLEQMLVGINRQLKRNKVFDRGRCQGHIVAALDGIEILSSYSRCRDGCLERRVQSKDGDGNADCHLKQPSVHQDVALVVPTMIRVPAYTLTTVFYHRQVRSHCRKRPPSFCETARTLAPALFLGGPDSS